MYAEVKPSDELRFLIDSFWIFSKKEKVENFKILPDTCTDLIFDFNQNKGFISGIMSNFQVRELPENCDLIGIRFKSERFGSFTKMPLDRTKNLQIEFSEIFSSDGQSVIARIHDFKTLSERIRFLECIVATTIGENLQRKDELVVSIAETIRFLKGNVNINDLAKSNQISLRQLERRFKRYIGLNIKEFANIVRFSYAKRAISSFNEYSLMNIAFDMGYFDHAHMNHEFKRISGENPSNFR